MTGLSKRGGSMELWQLRTLVAVAETLNFTKASEKLYLTQSAVSHQIKALEEEFGVPLFIRAKSGVHLTEAGETALEYAQKILRAAEELRERVAAPEKALAGRVRVAAATQALVYLFAPLFEEFMDEFDAVELVFRTTTSTEQTVEDILNGVSDVGFASLGVFSPILRVDELFDDELVVAVGRRHRLAGKREIAAAELKKERWILFERGASIRRATDDFFKKLKIGPETALESNDTYFIKLMIERGLGVALIPSWAIREEIRSGRLATVRVKNHRLRRAVAMVSLKGAQTAPLQAFLKFIIGRRENLQRLALD